ncbi:MAG: LysR family transcriptional regulator substrate-binding protein, partial [Aeriscardovia sp.]|nr:LysR family transcriptional regulator substrate-binding protein [Aeriscardovia sp.]
REIKKLKDRYPSFTYHITSGDTEQVTEKLDKGILDFGVICELPNKEKYEYLPFPSSDRWGAVMLKNHPLAKKKNIKVSDLIGQPLFCSEQSWNIEIPEWAGERFSDLHLEGSFSLSYNASMFAKEGLGILLTFEHLINCSEESDLVFRPLSPKQETKLYLIWNKYQTFTPIAEKFLAQVKASF